MKKYIALLRGVNVGGKNKISMPLLKTALEETGFLEVSTYINSGNIIFCSPEEDILVLKKRCEQAILDAFGLDITTAIVSAEDYTKALENAPSWWGEASETTHNLIVVIPPVETGFVMAAVGEPKPEYEQVFSHGQAIFWSAPRKTFSRTRWSKITATPVYGSITIRNANTARKLCELIK